MAKERVERDEEDLVRLYLTDIGQYPLLTKDDEVRLAQAIEVGNVRTNGPAENDPAALDAGVAGKDVPAADITASYVYEHPMKLRARRTLGKAPDAGAYEATVE